MESESFWKQGKIGYVFLCLVLLAACGDGIKEGVVFRKEFRPAAKGYQTEQHTRIHNRGRSSSTVTRTFRVAYPDRWVIYVCSDTDTADFFVKKEIYDTINVGSWFVFDTTMGTFGEPYKRIP